jgi:hypothetical protein
MTKGRAVPPERVVTEQKAIFPCAQQLQRVIPTGGAIGLRPTQDDDQRLLFSNYSLWRHRPPFVISTEEQRSGEISVWMLFLGNVSI